MCGTGQPWPPLTVAPLPAPVGPAHLPRGRAELQHEVGPISPFLWPGSWPLPRHSPRVCLLPLTVWAAGGRGELAGARGCEASRRTSSAAGGQASASTRSPGSSPWGWVQLVLASDALPGDKSLKRREQARGKFHRKFCSLSEKKIWEGGLVFNNLFYSEVSTARGKMFFYSSTSD